MDNKIENRTLGKWVIANKGVICSDNGEKELWQRNNVCQVLGDTSKGESKSNAEFICKAVNEYDKLKKSNDVLLSALKNIRGAFWSENEDFDSRVIDLKDIAERAILLAEQQ